MFKGFKREPAKGPLCDFREQDITNLLKTICHNPHTTIRNRQTNCAKRKFWQTIAYKIINTADSMIGYRNARYLAFGSGAARLDDLLNLVPARITALLICLAALFRGRALAAIRIMLRDGKTHASPNAGWPEAAMAGALDVWLAGPRRYGRRLRHAPRFHETGTDADAAAILSSLRLLAGAQIIFAILMAAMIGLPALVNAG